jgi:predicted 3-demethylubiquinone-9 3-methyltransferase (glyoxalase superfamily)
MSGISPCIWMDGEGEEAAGFYVDLFRRMGRQAETKEMLPSTKSTPGDHSSVLTVTFILDSVEFMILNGGPQYPLSPAISFTIYCRDQAEVDGFWSGLLEGGGREVQCGWLSDRFGVSWQIVPEVLPRLLMDADRGRADRVMQAMLKMVKLDIAGLQRAYDGDGGS